MFFLSVDSSTPIDCAWLSNCIDNILSTTLPGVSGNTQIVAMSPEARLCPGHLYSELVMLLQRLADSDVHLYSVFEDSEANVFKVYVEIEDYETAFYAGELATDILNAALADTKCSGFDIAAELAPFLEQVTSRRMDDNSRLILHTARKLGIPAIDLEQPPFASTRPRNPINHGLLQLGLCGRQHRFLAAMPQGAAAKVPSWIYQREALLAKLLEANLPLPRLELEFPNKNRFKRVLRAAQKIGFPVVLKTPASSEFRDARPASEVIGPLWNDKQLELAFTACFDSNRAAWVESYQPGVVYRFLIMAGKLVSIVELDAPVLVGDGSSNLRMLIEQQAHRAETRRKEQAWRQLLTHRMTPVRLQLQGLALDAVPAAGIQVKLDFARIAHTRKGQKEWFDLLPERYHSLASQAAKSVGLDFAGVDISIVDLRGPARAPNCAILGLRPEPDLAVHAMANSDRGVQAVERIIQTYFRTRTAAVVPIVAITGTNGKTTTSRMIASMFRQAGNCTGLACSDGVYVDNTLLESGDLAGITGSQMLYPRPEIQALVLETARGGLITLGRSFDRCDVGVCLNIAADHLGMHGVETLDQLAVVKRQIIEHSHGAVVLNADDPRCVAMAQHAHTSRIILFSGQTPSESLARHLEAGGEAVYVSHDKEGRSILVQHDRYSKRALIAVDDIPATMFGKARHNVENAAAACAAGLAAGLADSAVVEALRGFQMGFATTPGRLNELPGLPYRVLMDAAHNLHGLRALMTYLDQVPTTGKRILVIGVSSRFPEIDVREVAGLIAGRFDRFIVKRYRPVEQHVVCPAPWTVLKDELLRIGTPEEAITIELDGKAALACAIANVEADDLLVILVPAGRSLETGAWEELMRLTKSVP